MSTLRKLGIAFCVFGFIAVCILAIVLPTRPSDTAGFASLNGIQAELADEAFPIAQVHAPNAGIRVKGRVVNVVLPETVPASFDRSELRAELKKIDGVRSVTMTGDPQIALDPADRPDPVATEAPAVAPTEAPEPDPTATVEPTPEPTSQPSLSEVLDDLGDVSIEFEPGTPELTAADETELDEVAAQLRRRVDGPVEVQVHTDNVGDPDANLLLSQDRAQAVTDYLIDQGVDAALLSPAGFGASQPIADNSTEQGRADNQRVVFVVEGN